jgi:hypothetical protein
MREYNDHLCTNGHFVAEEPLQPPETALTLTGKTAKLRRPRDLIPEGSNFRYGLGRIEIRPADLNEMMKESKQQRRKDTHVESEPSE